MESDKLKLFAVIVFYNPDKKAFDNLSNLKKCPYFDKVMIFDNSDNKNDCDLYNDVIYVNFGENKGIAYALSYAMQYAIDNNYDYVLTLDQDSIFPYDKMKIITEKLNNAIYQRIGIVALNYNNKYKSNKDVKFINSIITSGNFVKVSAYKMIEGFNEELFIDYVDFDMCRQMVSAGFSIMLLTKISIIQTIGNPIIKRFLFKKIKVMNPSCIRYYYRFRNLKYLKMKNFRFYFFKNIKEHFSVILMLLYEKNKMEKISMIRKGKKDAKVGVLGKYCDK